MKIDRMIGILSILLQKEKVTAPYLAEKFEVSRRTINRDIEALCMAGIPLVTEPGRGGGISIMEGYNIDRALFTSADMQAILAGLRGLDSISGSNRYQQLMEKLSAGTSNLIAADTHILIDLSSWYKSALAPKIELLHSAILTGNKVCFTYFSPRGESVRNVEPYYLVFQWAGWYLWGWCDEREDFRLFKLMRMTNLCMQETFEKRSVSPPNLNADRVFPPTYQVKAKIRPSFQWRLVEEFGPACFRVLPDGMLLFSADFSDRNNLVGWIASFGGGAELLEPVELREEVLRFAENICRNHRPDSET